MSLDLHQDCLSRLIDAVAEHLGNIKVNKDVLLDFYSMRDLSLAEEILPKTGKLRDRLNRYIGEIPLFDFLYETISRDIYESGVYNDGNKESSLTDLPNYADLHAVAQRLISEFNSLPWKYIVSFELNTNLGQFFRKSIKDYDVTKDIRIVSPGANYDKIYPLQSGIKQRDQNLFIKDSLLEILGFNKHWNQETAYLQLQTEGFIGKYIETAPVEKAISTLKSFIGLSVAVGLLKIKDVDGGLPFSVPTSRLIVHRQIKNQWQIWATYELPIDLSEILNKLEVDDLNGRIGDDRIGEWISNRLALVSTAFKNAGKAEKILLAGEWLLDSYVGKNELLSFVQATVVMEILLGKKSESDFIGIGELLCNRCAYLIGKSYSQREQILKDFKDIYKVRSKIVHRGKSRLDPGEMGLFRKLQWMCGRVITEELNLIVRDKKETT